MPIEYTLNKKHRLGQERIFIYHEAKELMYLREWELIDTGKISRRRYSRMSSIETEIKRFGKVFKI